MTTAGARQTTATAATVALLAAGVLLAAADTLLPVSRSAAWLSEAGLSRDRGPVAAQSVPVLAGSAVLACPLPPEPVAAAGTDEQFATQPEETTSRVRAAAAPATTSELRLGALTAPDAPQARGDEEPTVVTGQDGPLIGEVDAAGPVAVFGEPAQEDTAPAPTAVQWALTRSGDVRGLSAGGCTSPAAESWLVGGGTDIGRSTRLVLSNPGSTPGVIDVVLLTSTGRQTPRAGQGVLVAPGEVTEVLVEGLASVDPLLAVGVTSSGGAISATLVDSALSGVDAAGVEVVTPSQALTRHILPGLSGGTDEAVLRIAVPDDDPAAVGWRLEGTAGPVVASQEAAATVPGGSVIDVRLEELGAGPLSLVVESDVPVLAAVQATRAAPGTAADAGAAVQERAWIASAAPVDGPVLMALPGGDVTATLVLAAGEPEGPEVEVVPISDDGSSGEELRVAALPGATAQVTAAELDGAVAVRIDPGSGTVHGAVVLTASSDVERNGSDLLSVVAVPPPPEAPGAVVVQAAPEGQWP